VPPAVEAVVMSCLAKYPDQRPKTAWDLAQSYEKALGKRILTSRSGPSPSRSIPTLKGLDKPNAAPPIRPASRNAVEHTIEASMLEAMAMIKLKGFVYDLGGEVVESVPGMIKVRLQGQRAEKKPLFGWMAGGRSVAQAIQSTDIELHMQRRDPSQANKLTITLVMRPQGGPATADWKSTCNQITRDLQAYLMGR